MNKYEIIQEEIETKVKEERKDNNSFIQIRSARLREIQDPENPIHAKHEIEYLDCNNDKVFDIPYCKNCQTVLMRPEAY